MDSRVAREAISQILLDQSYWARVKCSTLREPVGAGFWAQAYRFGTDDRVGGGGGL